MFPVRPLDKRPLHKNWQDESTTDPAIISRWFAENPHINYGIATGAINGLYVVDLDGPEAQTWWRSTGLADGAKVSTPSGPDRTHHYFRIDTDIDLPNTKGSIAPHVDSRGEGGLVVGPGSVLATGTYRGDLSHIPDIDQALIDLLPQKQQYEYSPEEVVTTPGEKVTEASEYELRKLRWITQTLDSLDRPWHEGAGWRSEMFRSACWLSRMVNSPYFALTEDGALTLLLTHTPTDDVWTDADLLEQWESARKTTYGQAERRPVETLPPLLPVMDILNGPTMTDRLYTAVKAEPIDSPWKHRKNVMVEAFRLGYTPEQVATLGWNSVAAQSLQMEPDGITKLWAEVEKAKEAATAETGEGFEPPSALERPALDGRTRRLTLMTDAERELAQSRTWFGTEYLGWAESRVSMMNLPYHRMNLWTILSLAFAQYGYIPARKGPINLALFQFVLGKTTTGKTESVEIAESVIRACFPGDANPDIGGDATANALTELLIMRDGQPSWFNADEAHGLFEEMQNAGWRGSLIQRWTKLYEGRVPMIQRNGKRDLSGINATTYFVMHLMGTIDGMTSVLHEELWSSGFLARFLWAIGEDQEATPESFLEIDADGDTMEAYDLMPKHWAGEFAGRLDDLTKSGKTFPVKIGMTNDARARHVQLKRQLGTMFKGHRQEELLRPVGIRFAISVRKCASLVAMSDGRSEVNLLDELTVLEFAEEWLANMVYMTEQTTATSLSRDVNRVERFIANTKTREVRQEKVFAYFTDLDNRRVDECISRLVLEGRVTKHPAANEGTVIRIHEKEMEMAA